MKLTKNIKPENLIFWINGDNGWYIKELEDIITNGISYKRIIVYNSNSLDDDDTDGHFCGYIGFDNKHPLYGKYYDDINVLCDGGLSYSGTLPVWMLDYIKNDEKRWFIGFDTNTVIDKEVTYNDVITTCDDIIKQIEKIIIKRKECEMKIDQIGKCFTLVQHYKKKGEKYDKVKTLAVWYNLPSKCSINQAIMEEYKEVEGIDASKIADKVVGYLGIDLFACVKDGITAKRTTSTFTLNNGDTVFYTLYNYIEFEDKDNNLKQDAKQFFIDLADHLKTTFENTKIGDNDELLSDGWSVTHGDNDDVFVTKFKNKNIRVVLSHLSIGACWSSIIIDRRTVVSDIDWNNDVKVTLIQLVEKLRALIIWLNAFDVAVTKEPTIDDIFNVISESVESEVKYLTKSFKTNDDVVDMLYYLNCLLKHCNYEKDDEFLVSYADIKPEDRANLNKLIRLSEVKSLGSDIMNMIEESDYEWNLKHRKDCVKFLCELGNNVDDLITEQ